MSDSVFMSSELEDRVELEEKPKLVPDADDNLTLWAKFTRDGKKSKKFLVKLYEERSENSVAHRVVTMVLEKKEFLSVARNLPTGFVLSAGDDEFVTVVTDEPAKLLVAQHNPRDAVFHVRLTF